MLKIILFIGILLNCFVWSSAQNRNSNTSQPKATEVRSNTVFKISSGDGQLISLNIDGRIFNKPSRQMLIDNINSGNHHIVVYVNKIKGNGKIRQYELYRGTIFIRPNNVNIATVYRNGSMKMNYAQVQVRQKSDNINEQFVKIEDDKITTSDNSNPESTSPNNNTIIIVKDASVDDEKFVDLGYQLDKEPFENSKLQLIDTYLKTNQTITIDQLLELGNQFSFESSKISLIKSANKYIVDRTDINKLYSMFTFQSSKDELTKILEKK